MGAHLETVKAIDRAIRRGDWDTALPLFHPDVEWNSLIPASFRGRDGVKRFWREWVGTWDEYENVVDEIEEVGDHVVVVAHERGRGKGSGVEVDVYSGGVWSFRDDMVVKVQLYEEPEQAYEAARGEG